MSSGSIAADDNITDAKSSQFDLVPLAKVGSYVHTLPFELVPKDLKKPGQYLASNGLHKPALRQYNYSTETAKNFDHKGNCAVKNDGSNPKTHILFDLVHVDSCGGNSDPMNMTFDIVSILP